MRDQKTAGEYRSGEKEPAVLEGYFYPAQISRGAVPPLPSQLFLSQDLESAPSPMDGRDGARMYLRVQHQDPFPADSLRDGFLSVL